MQCEGRRDIVQLYVVAPEWHEELDRPPRQFAYDPLGELSWSLDQSAAKIRRCRRTTSSVPSTLRLGFWPTAHQIGTASCARSPRPVPSSLAPTRTPGRRWARAEPTLATSSGPRPTRPYRRSTGSTPEGAGRLRPLAPRPRTAAPPSRIRQPRAHRPASRPREGSPAYLAAEPDQQTAYPVAAPDWRRYVAAIARYRTTSGLDDPEYAWAGKSSNERLTMARDPAVRDAAAVSSEAGLPQEIERADGLIGDP